MLPSEEILSRAARDGSLDSSSWPPVFSFMMYKLQNNVFREFDIPVTQSNPSPIQPSPFPMSNVALPPDSSDGAEADRSVPPSSPPRSHPATLDTADSSVATSLPPTLQSTYDFVVDSLKTNFSNQPPHTIQRLAELVLSPKQHHRFLHSYLNALDRVVCVSSPLSAFPLPAVEIPPATGLLVNGTAVTGTAGFGSDESLGGALLTPISWLNDSDSGSSSPRRDSQDMPSETMLPTNGAISGGELDTGSDTPMRDAGAVTQGELLRQEQEAGDPPAPVSSLPFSGNQASPPQEMRLGDGDDSIIEDPDQPHARGPEEIGLEDTGLQEHPLGIGQKLDMEAAVGRRGSSPARTTDAGESAVTNAHESNSSEPGNSAALTQSDSVKDIDEDVDMSSGDRQQANDQDTG